jgi:hypothetical protein
MKRVRGHPKSTVEWISSVGLTGATLFNLAGASLEVHIICSSQLHRCWTEQ